MGKLGDVFMGSNRQKGQAQLLTPEQRQFLSGMLVPEQQQAAQQATMGLLAPQGMEEAREAYQQSVVSPALQSLRRDIIPQIQESFSGANAGSSSALNLALARSAEDITQQLANQFGQYYAGEQQRQMQGQLGGLSYLGGLAGQRTFEPIIQQKQGLLGPLIGAGGQALGGYYAGKAYRPVEPKS
jgi:hypothetical protein